MGIDPGSHVMGWGIIEVEGSKLRHVASGAIRAEAGPLPLRLFSIATALEQIIREHAPGAISVETVFFAKNVQSALKLGEARGVALLCAARAGIEVHEYTAGQIKQATTGRGRAEKDQVQHMIRLILGLHERMALDTSDALAAAVCHAQMLTSPAAVLAQKVRGA